MANDEPGHLPTTFDITPFSFTPTMTARLHKRDWVPFAISTSPVIHNTPCLPHTPHPPPPPQAFSIRIVFNFSWEDYNTQEKLKTKIMQNLVYYTRDVQMANAVFEKRSLSLRFYYIKHRTRILDS